MLERCFVRPETLDRIRSSWLGPPIERYAAWLTITTDLLTEASQRFERWVEPLIHKVTL